jgi:two-component system chemotaxis response regulator CheB
MDIVSKNFDCVVIGSSAGGIDALTTLFTNFPGHFPIPIVIVQHIARGLDLDFYLPVFLNERTDLTVKEAEEKEKIRLGHVYVAPPGYHLIIERDKTLSLSLEVPACYSIPGIDVLFETAADAFRNRLIGIVLTGASADGSEGLKKIKEMGGYTIVQNPLEAKSPIMPES